jgi:hypothetical protein
MTSRFGSSSRYADAYLTTTNCNDAKCKTLSAATGIVYSSGQQRGSGNSTGSDVTIFTTTNEGELGIVSFQQASGSLTNNGWGGSFIYSCANGSGNVASLGKSTGGTPGVTFQVTVSGSADNYTYSIKINNNNLSYIWTRTRIN